MISKLNFLEFVKFGKELISVNLNDSEEDVFKKAGLPLKTIGDKMTGFFHYDNGIRLGYFNKEIDELSIYFYGNENISIPLTLEDGDKLVLTEKSQIHEMILYLNDKKIPWKSNDESNLNVFSIITNNSVYFIFDLETGFITNISVSR